MTDAEKACWKLGIEPEYNCGALIPKGKPPECGLIEGVHCAGCYDAEINYLTGSALTDAIEERLDELGYHWSIESRPKGKHKYKAFIKGVGWRLAATKQAALIAAVLSMPEGED